MQTQSSSLAECAKFNPGSQESLCWAGLGGLGRGKKGKKSTVKLLLWRKKGETKACRRHKKIWRAFSVSVCLQSSSSTASHRALLPEPARAVTCYLGLLPASPIPSTAQGREFASAILHLQEKPHSVLYFPFHWLWSTIFHLNWPTNGSCNIYGLNNIPNALISISVSKITRLKMIFSHRHIFSPGNLSSRFYKCSHPSPDSAGLWVGSSWQEDAQVSSVGIFLSFPAPLSNTVKQSLIFNTEPGSSSATHQINEPT